MAATAETRTDRLVVLISPSEKRRLAEQAQRANMSVSELVRTAAEGFGDTQDISPEVIAALTAQVREAADRARCALDALDAEAERIRAFDEEAYREAVRRELGR